MKTTSIPTLTVLCLSVLISACTSSAHADENVAASQTGKTYSGVIASVDTKEKTVTVKRLWFNETFNIGDDCRIAVGDKKAASDAELSDLRIGSAFGCRLMVLL